AHSLEPVWAFLTPCLDEITACIAALDVFRSGVLGTTKLAYDALLSRLDRLYPRAVPLLDPIPAMEEVAQTVGKTRPRHANTTQEIELAQIFARIKTACEEAKVLFGNVATREEQTGAVCHRLWGLVIAVWKEYHAAKRRRGKLDS